MDYFNEVALTIKNETDIKNEPLEYFSDSAASGSTISDQSIAQPLKVKHENELVSSLFFII